jgi:hypothetical protein
MRWDKERLEKETAENLTRIREFFTDDKLVGLMLKRRMFLSETLINKGEEEARWRIHEIDDWLGEKTVGAISTLLVQKRG